MRKTILSVGLALVLALSASPRALGGEEETLIKVTAIGIGTDSDSALKNAFKNAVEQAVGSLVDSKTVIENDEVISDKILSHSGGFVKKHTVIEGPAPKAGMVEVKINAEIQRTQLLAQLTTEKIVVKQVDGRNLGGEAISKSMTKGTSTEMLTEILKGFPEDYMKLAITQEPSVDETGKKVRIKVQVSPDTERLEVLVKKLDLFLEQAADKKLKNVRSILERGTEDGYPSLYMPTMSMREYVNKQFRIYLMARIDDEKTITMWKAYVISKDMAKMFLKQVENPPSMLVEVLDSGGELIESKNYKLHKPYTYTSYSNEMGFSILPHLALTDRKFASEPLNYTLTFDTLFPDEIQDIREVKLSIINRDYS